MRTDALIALLEKHGPETLGGLRERHPEQLRRGPRGEVLGQEDVQTFAAELALQAILTAKEKLEPCLRTLRNRLHRARKLRFMASLVALPSGAGVIAALLAHWPYWLAISAAAVNAAAALCSIIAEYLESPRHGGTGSLIGMFEDLLMAEIRAENLAPRIQRSLEEGVTGEQLEELVNQANEVAATLMLGIRTLGIE